MSKTKFTLIAALILIFNSLLSTLNCVAQPCKTASGAAVGNASVWQYPPTSISLAHPSGESLTANAFTGTPTGAHVYRVDFAPVIYGGTCATGTMNPTTGVTGLGSNDRYFGVFVAGGTSPTYTATYNYWGNPAVNTSNEASLMLFKRNNNAVSPWANAGAVLNTTANTLTKTGEAGRGEYILGTSGTPLPIKLLSFEAKATPQSKVQCLWQTATEINNDFFTLEKTKDGVHYTWVAEIPGAGNSNTILSYNFTDKTPFEGTSFYRLKQTDFDGQFSYSQLEPVNLETIEIINIYPNPAVNSFEYVVGNKKDTYVTVKIIDATGRIVYAKSELVKKGLTKTKVDVPQLASGNYLLQIIAGDNQLTQKQFLIKK